MTRRAVIVRGGWDGHDPVGTTDEFVPFLREEGFDVRIETSPEVYASLAESGPVDLIVQCVTMSEISADAARGLRDAVAAGAGLVGWHGGIADSFRASSDYLQLIGGQFAAHPHPEPDGASAMRRYTVELTDAGRAHPITAGLDDFELTTEQYWVLHDDAIDVLATTTHEAPDWQPWHRPVTSPAVWTRLWGRGRVAVVTPGHDLATVRDQNVRTIIERSMLWASRTASA